jgi:hypothetical protein
MVAMANCYHGCIDYDVDIGDGIYVVDADETECSACSSGEATTYTIEIYTDGCEGTTIVTTSTFCPLVSDIPVDQGEDSWFYVQSIGSGCSGTPQGCVRICPCP